MKNEINKADMKMNKEKKDRTKIDGKEVCYRLKDEYWPFEKETNKSVPTNKEPEESSAVEHVPLFEKLKKKLGI